MAAIDNIFKNDRTRMDEFVVEWERREGYKPAPFQKAIAMQRFLRGQSVDEVIAALIAQRV